MSSARTGLACLAEPATSMLSAAGCNALCTDVSIRTEASTRNGSLMVAFTREHEVDHAGRIASAAILFESVERAKRASCARSDAHCDEPRLWRGAARHHHRQHRARCDGQDAG